MSVSIRNSIKSFLRSHHRLVKIGMVVLGIAALAQVGNREVQGVQIGQEPMEAAATSAAPNVMFVLDNSGSMDWEFMTQESDGTFRWKYYVFDDAGDNAYWGSILSGGDRGYYKGQCSGYNKIYYNPRTGYLPWPSTPGNSFSNADINNPRSNPTNAGDTLDLSAAYWNLANGDIYIIDDLDGAPAFSQTGPWIDYMGFTTYNGHDWWAATAGDYTAVWQQVIANTGQYEVSAWWDQWAGYTTADYTVTHAGGGTTVTVDQGLNGGSWFPLGLFNFNGGSTARIEMGFTQVAGENRCADAIRIASTVATNIRINNAHYYTWDDVDGDGGMDAGETVYLVNFTDPNSDGDLADAVRAYYRLDGDGDDLVESGELVIIGDLPAHLRPAVYDDEGNFDHYRSDAEDLQNFANWYSYYRRRELAAKAAVANTLIDLEAVNVGFYTIHPTDGNNVGVRQEVLPIKLNAPSGSGAIIVDNQDSRYSESGSWGESSASNEYNNSSRYTSGIGNWARWTPNLPQTGTYNVYAWWDYWSTRDTNALYTVHHAGGDDTHRVNQQQNYSQWVLLGTYTFNAGTAGYLQVTRDGSSTQSSTSADAAMFEPVGAMGVNVYRDETNTLLDQLYSIQSADGTPLRYALNNVGRYYDADDGLSGNLGSAPWASCGDGGACQKSFAIVMTDGYWNGSSPGVGNQDSGQGAPYQDGYSDTLADVAMKYYKNDLSSGLDNTVAPSGCDQATHQHMTTYSVSFGVIGTLDPDDYDYYGDDPCLITHTPGGASGWPSPHVGTQSKIDDLWHASVNGRGQFFSASSPEELVASLKAIVEHVEQSVSSGASVSVNGEELSEETVLYQARYKSGDWTGEVIAREIDPITHIISTDELWNASDYLQALASPASERKIVTFDANSNSVIRFQANTLMGYQKTALDPVWQVDVGSPTLIEKLVVFLRGEEVAGMRPRAKILGDIVHSAPVFVSSYVPANNDGIDNDDDYQTDEGSDGVDNDYDGQIDEMDEWEWKKQATLYAGGNDGMVHAFNAEDGTERFAYVPNLLFDEIENDPTLGEVSRLRLLASTAYEHRFFVDLTPSFKEIWRDADADVLDNDGDGWDNEGDGVDNDADGTTDERIDDGIDNDGDGQVDEIDELEMAEVRTLLVGGLGAGGKGYYGLTLRRVVQMGGVWTEIFNADTWQPSTSESTIAASLLAWEYPDLEILNIDGVDNDSDGITDSGTDGVDNDGDGTTDERDEYETDPDMGYSYSSAHIVKSFSAEHPWVVIFGNGYNSESGEAVLYILDAFDGTLVRKIHTQCGPGNGLSTPALVALNTRESLIKWNTDGIDNDHHGDTDDGTDASDNNGDGHINEGAFDDLDNDGDGFVDETSYGASAEIGEWEKAPIALDDIVAFAYAGDLKGNLWKFDLTSPDPAEWDVVYKCRAGQDCNADGNIDASDVVGSPQPLFQTVGQPITTKPDVMRPCQYGLNGHMVIFGTGRYLHFDDRDPNNFETQTLYGVWDYGDSYDLNKADAVDYYDDSEYLGYLDRATGKLSNFDPADNVKLLKQEEVDWQTYTDMHGNSFDLRISSDHDASYVGVPDKNGKGRGRDPDAHNWGSDGIDNDGDGLVDENLCIDGIDNDGDGQTDEADECDCGDGLDSDGDGYVDEPCEAGEHCGTWAADGLDNDRDGGMPDEADEEVCHAGWYFDLPGFGDKSDPATVREGERVIEDVMIRGGVLIAITSAPKNTPCSGGGESLVMELNPCTGARMSCAQFDINGDGRIDEGDLVAITDASGNTIMVAPSAKLFQGLLQPPVILKTPGGDDLKVLSDSSGGTQTMLEEGAGENFQFWKELEQAP